MLVQNICNILRLHMMMMMCYVEHVHLCKHKHARGVQRTTSMFYVYYVFWVSNSDHRACTANMFTHCEMGRKINGRVYYPKSYCFL